MMSQIREKLRSPLDSVCSVTRPSSNVTQHPINAVINDTNLTRGFGHSFQSKRHRPRVFAVPTRVSTTQLNDDGSERVDEKTKLSAITSTIQKSRQGDLHLFPALDGFEFKLLRKLLDLSRCPFKACPQSSSSTSGQKRPQGNTEQGKKGKKSRKGNGSKEDPGDGADGGARRPKKHDGLRFPKIEEPPEKTFDCPFCKEDPIRYQVCMGHRMPRLSDVTQHLERRHLLQEKDHYCQHCRMEFHEGPDLPGSRDGHIRLQNCTAASIKDTGVMLPGEFKNMKEALKGLDSQEDKWYEMWKRLFKLPLPPSPYVEDISTMAEAACRRGSELTILEALNLSLRRLGFNPNRDQILSIGLDICDALFRASPPTTQHVIRSTIAAGAPAPEQQSVSESPTRFNIPPAPGSVGQQLPFEPYYTANYITQHPHFPDTTNSCVLAESVTPQNSSTQQGYSNMQAFDGMIRPTESNMSYDLGNGYFTSHLPWQDAPARPGTPSQCFD